MGHTSICYKVLNDVGTLKEILHFIEAEAWSMHEFIVITLHFAIVIKKVVQMLIVHILPTLPNGSHCHVNKIQLSVLRKQAKSNLVVLKIWFHPTL